MFSVHGGSWLYILGARLRRTKEVRDVVLSDPGTFETIEVARQRPDPIRSTAPTPAEPPPTGSSVGAPEVTSEAFVDTQVSSGMFQSQLLDSPMVTQFEGDGAGGFDITYRIDGTD